DCRTSKRSTTACRRSGTGGSSPTASTPNWFARGTATPAACAAPRGCGPDRLRDDLIQLTCGDPEVRRIPHRLAVAQQDRLRRFVTDAQALGGSVGHGPMRLHGDHLVGDGAAGLALHVRLELVQRLAAHAAIPAVLEEKDGPLARLCYGGVQRLDVHQGRQRFHWM